MRRSRGELRRRRLLAPALAGLFLLFLELADEALFVDCATAAGASAAKPAHKIKSASTPTDCQRLRTTLYLLSPKIGAHDGTVVFGQAAYQFVIEIIAARGRSIAITLPLGRPALLDVILQAVIHLFVLPSFAACLRNETTSSQALVAATSSSNDGASTLPPASVPASAQTNAATFSFSTSGRTRT